MLIILCCRRYAKLRGNVISVEMWGKRVERDFRVTSYRAQVLVTILNLIKRKRKKRNSKNNNIDFHSLYRL